MRKLIASAFVSLDGVMQAPGGPDEDPTGGFGFGGWIAKFMDPTSDISESGFDGTGRDIVLGRFTYEIFEAYWPYQAPDNPIAISLNSAKKYVASRTLKEVGWNNAELLGDDAVAALRKLKAQPGRDLQTIGSANLLQSLQAASLIDELNVWTYPLVLGRGKRLFETNSKPSTLRLVKTQTSSTGVVMSRYEPVGEVEPGTMVTTAPSDKELKRRAKLS
ncbi:MAG: dihydrofolate reductase family protein [Bdellovibrionota bacterium]